MPSSDAVPGYTEVSIRSVCMHPLSLNYNAPFCPVAADGGLEVLEVAEATTFEAECATEPAVLVSDEVMDILSVDEAASLDLLPLLDDVGDGLGEGLSLSCRASSWMVEAVANCRRMTSRTEDSNIRYRRIVLWFQICLR